MNDFDQLEGIAPLLPLLNDEKVTEIMVNGPDDIYVEVAGTVHYTGIRLASEAELRRLMERIVGAVGRRIDEQSPMCDARLPDGSRVNAVLPPVAVDGPSLTIRKFARDRLKVDDLIQVGSGDEDLFDFLRACVEARASILISGGTGTGKTTLLNVLSGFIPDRERVVTIEDAAELQLHQHHVVRLEARPPEADGAGRVSIRDLVINALRMRPDRIVVGECRGSEALDMLQAMNTGHDGSLTTLHANTPRDALSRLETLVLMAGYDLPVKAIRQQVASAIDVLVHLERLRDGSRRITEVSEVSGMEADTITLQPIFRFRPAGADGEGRVRGVFEATGLRPRMLVRMAEMGLTVPEHVAELFPDTFAHATAWS